MDSKNNRVELSNFLIVREFSDVFSKELYGLVQEMEVEFPLMYFVVHLL
jgi:hypothetical protein